MLAICGVLGAGLGVVAARHVSPKYRATTVLVWDDASEVEPATIDRKIRTAVDQIEMPTTLARVRTQLAIPSTLDSLAARIEAHTTVGSDLVHLSAIGSTGPEAAALADQVAVEFLGERALQVRRLAREHAEEVGRQIETTTRALGIARQARDEFRREHGVIDLQSERTIAVEQRAVLSTDSERARADAGVETSRATDLREATSLLPSVTVLTETESRPDVRRLAEAENELAALRGRLTEDSPRLQAKVAEVDELRKRASRNDLVVRAERIVGRNPIRDFLEQNQADAAARAVAAERRHDAYRDLADKTKLRVEELNRLEGEAAELDGKVLSIETRLGALRRDQQASLERAEVGGADLHVMAAASVPPRPYASNRRLIAFAAPSVLVLLAVLVLLVRALRGLRVMTPRELAYWSGYPVIGACDRLTKPEELDGLASELATLLATLYGETLIVPATSYEVAATRALASQLETTVSERSDSSRAMEIALWPDAPVGSALRRRVRAAKRVVIVVASAAHRPWTVRRLAAQIGRLAGVGLVVIDVGTDLAVVADRVGDVETLLGRPLT